MTPRASNPGGAPLKWLIAEDSLQGRTGHWFEYLEGFVRELPRLGDEVSLWVSREADAFILQQLRAEPLLPAAAYLKMSDGAPRWRRYARVPLHAFATRRAVRAALRRTAPPDVIFVPTVILAHLLAWTALIKHELRGRSTRVLLFFPSLPLRAAASGAQLDGSPTSKVMRRWLHSLRPEIAAGRVVLGVETAAMRRAAEAVFEVPFTYFPHPVDLPSPAATPVAPPLTLGCYGPARHEKGSDVLAAAIEVHLARFPQSLTRFVLQWTADFALPDGTMARLPDALRRHPRVTIIDRLFGDGEYARQLAATHALLLPYRQSSYALRLSRVALEAVVRGLPVIATAGTTLGDQVAEFGSGLACQDGDPASLVAAIQELESRYDDLHRAALARAPAARAHFSVRSFRQALTEARAT